MKKRILIVDDERWFTNLLEYSLETEGYYDVRQENSAAHALQAAREYAPDLIILDIMMPHYDGSELAARFKADRLLADLPVIFLTALVIDADAPDGSCSRGGQTFLPKGVAIERLIECIEAKLGNGCTPAVALAAS
jgi:CheY-like chemotaxis protein